LTFDAIFKVSAEPEKLIIHGSIQNELINTTIKVKNNVVLIILGKFVFATRKLYNKNTQSRICDQGKIIFSL
jgi:hypothetical protein